MRVHGEQGSQNRQEGRNLKNKGGSQAKLLNTRETTGRHSGSGTHQATGQGTRCNQSQGPGGERASEREGGERVRIGCAGCEKAEKSAQGDGTAGQEEGRDRRLLPATAGGRQQGQLVRESVRKLPHFLLTVVLPLTHVFLGHPARQSEKDEPSLSAQRPGRKGPHASRPALRAELGGGSACPLFLGVLAKNEVPFQVSR